MIIETPIIMLELIILYLEKYFKVNFIIAKLTNKIPNTIINCENSTPIANPNRGFNLESIGNVI